MTKSNTLLFEDKLSGIITEGIIIPKINDNISPFLSATGALSIFLLIPPLEFDTLTKNFFSKMVTMMLITISTITIVKSNSIVIENNMIAGAIDTKK